MIKGVWAVVFCIGAIAFAGYLVGLIGYRADCGQVCECVGKIDGNLCTGLNLSGNQIVALTNGF